MVVEVTSDLARAQKRSAAIRDEKSKKIKEFAGEPQKSMDQNLPLILGCNERYGGNLPSILEGNERKKGKPHQF
jgi:hypothetical protein